MCLFDFRLSQCIRIDVPKQPGAQRETILLHDHRRNRRQDTFSSTTLQADGQHSL